MTRFLRSVRQPGKRYSIAVEKRCVVDEDHPYGWAELKEKVFASRKYGDAGLEECQAVWSQFIEPRTECMAYTLYRYCICAEPADENDGFYSVFSNERIRIPKRLLGRPKETGRIAQGHE